MQKLFWKLLKIASASVLRRRLMKAAMILLRRSSKYLLTDSRSKMSRFHYILDPGHGFMTHGKRSPVTDDGRQLLEYEFNQEIAGRLSELLTAHSIRHSITITNPREHADDLQFRAGYTKALTDVLDDVIFVSIHGNAGPGNEFNDKFTGIETFANENGEKIAEIFQKHIVRRTKLRDRGVKDGRWLYVLRNAPCPAVLTENGFFNGADFDLMMSDEFRIEVAKAHYEAIREIEKKIK